MAGDTGASLYKRSALWRSMAAVSEISSSNSDTSVLGQSCRLEGVDRLLVEKPDYEHNILPLEYYKERYNFFLDENRKIKNSQVRSRNKALRKYVNNKIAHYRSRVNALRFTEHPELIKIVNEHLHKGGTVESSARDKLGRPVQQRQELKAQAWKSVFEGCSARLNDPSEIAAAMLGTSFNAALADRERQGLNLDHNAFMMLNNDLKPHQMDRLVLEDSIFNYERWPGRQAYVDQKVSSKPDLLFDEDWEHGRDKDELAEH